ncbi:MAG: FHA domain-containing protein [Chthoniobacteraceae bacterium]
MPKFIVRHPEQGDLIFTLSGERATIGRHSDNDIQIKHQTISGHHAEIIRRNGRCIVHDLDSTNHSYIEGIMFIQAELDGACRMVLGTVECEFLPDNAGELPEEMDSLRKTVGFLRRQNDELVARIAEQKNQIDILGSLKLLTRENSSDLTSLREQVKSLAGENADLTAQVEVLHAKLGIPSIAKAVQPVAESGASARLPKPPVALGETVMIPALHAGSGGR